MLKKTILIIILGLIFVIPAFSDACTTVYTPNGSAVSAYLKTYELSWWEKSSLDSDAQAGYPNATLLRNSSRKYNCHSYAWHSQSSSNNIWIDNPSQYWLDYSYVGYCSSWPSSGSKVFYDHWSSIEWHSAIVYSGSTFTSKWGPGPLMRHSSTHCPYISSSLNYYR